MLNLFKTGDIENNTVAQRSPNILGVKYTCTVCTCVNLFFFTQMFETVYINGG